MAMDGPTLVVPQGTTGSDLETSMGFLIAMWELTTDITNNTYFSASGTDGTHLIIEVAASGIITHLSMKVPDGEGGYMDSEMWYSANPPEEPDTTKPQFTVIPEDFSADEGYSDLSVSWTASDLHPATYSIELDGTEVVSATTWTDGRWIA
ncbi:MAG: hypothetical protein ACTSRK_04390, partial [Promethearchaeota archaeon]